MRGPAKRAGPLAIWFRSKLCSAACHSGAVQNHLEVRGHLKNVPMDRQQHSAATRESANAQDSGAAATPDALCEIGLAHLEAGRLIDAQVSCQQALAIAPDHADGLHLMGSIARKARQDDHAVEWFARAIRQAPKPEYLTSLAFALQRLGRTEEALKAFDKAVQLDPHDAQAWKNLADLLFELKRMDVALLAYRRVLELDPRDWDAACRSGHLHHRSGQLQEALACFDICEAVRPNQASTLAMRMLLLLDLRRFEQAATEGMRAHALDPGNADTCNHVGAALQALDRHGDALAWFDRALGLRPQMDSALYNKAVSLGRMQRISDALAIHDRLKASLGPASSVTELSLTELLIKLGRLDDALDSLNSYCERYPNDAGALQLRAVCLRGLGQLERSLEDSRRAHAIDPFNASICSNIGAVLHELGDNDEALRWLETSTALQPDNPDALNNMTVVLGQLNRLTEMAAIYARIQAIAPDHAEAALGLAHLHLLRGEFEGWAQREVRWKVAGLPIVYPKFSQPMWRGERDISDKTILVYADEGIGDAIQFSRYVPMLAARGARVILVVHAALVPLLSKIQGVSLCLANDSSETMPAFELYCPMQSFPLTFGTRLDTVPASIPYLPLPAADHVSAWNDRLPSRDRLRVGLVWSGNPNHSNDRNRSIPLELFTRVLDADASFISLQKDVRPTDRSVLEQTEIIDLTAELIDFSKTAALLCCLDLVITVDTSVAHLAGALGRRTWILLPQPPDYRWLLDREDSPWYPTMRLFRQGETREYASVLDRVRSELAVLSAEYRRTKAEARR